MYIGLRILSVSSALHQSVFYHMHSLLYKEKTQQKIQPIN